MALHAPPKFAPVKGTVYRIRVTEVEGSPKHCYNCGAKTTRELQARNVTKSEKTVKLPVCDKCEGLAMLRMKMFATTS